MITQSHQSSNIACTTADGLLEHILFTVLLTLIQCYSGHLESFFLLHYNPNSERWSLCWSMNPLKVEQHLLTSVLFLSLIHPQTITLSFCERKVAPFVSTVTDVFSHLSVSGSAQ